MSTVRRSGSPRPRPTTCVLADGHLMLQDPEVVIQGDRNIEYSLLRKVMFTLSQSGYDNVSLAVLRKA